MRIKLLSAFCLASTIFFIACYSTSQQVSETPKQLSDHERDGLAGNVKAVLTEDVIICEQNGRQTETTGSVLWSSEAT